MHVPADPTALHPMPGQPWVVLLKPLVKSPLIEVREYSFLLRRPRPRAGEAREVTGVEGLPAGRQKSRTRTAIRPYDRSAPASVAAAHTSETGLRR